MGQALYRKYRPKSLNEIVGQEHITTTLSNAITSGKISHAYLLTGPRGVGKTSVARILAHEVNNIAYSDDAIHLDIIEIDAASNRRIDEIRNLRDKVHILPTSAKYKVYIIDEVHMLTREAFNALLKTLEEPPTHAIFILATTEAHKLPETIISRTQHYSFKSISTPTLVSHLKSITKSEKVQIDDGALELVAEHGDGSFRDSISLLDQARSISDHITEAQVQQLLGIAPAKSLDDLLQIVISGTAKELFNSLQQLRDQGLQSSIVARQLGQLIRNKILKDISLQTTETTQLLQRLLEVQASSQADRVLEITLLEYIFNNNPVTVIKKTDALEPTVITQEEIPKASKAKEKIVIDSKQDVPAATNEKLSTPESTAELNNDTIQATKSIGIDDRERFSEAAWPIIVAQVKKTNSTLYGILKMAEMHFDGTTITLRFKFAFHQKQINEAKNRKIIEDIILQQTGDSVAIVCTTIKSKKMDGSSKQAAESSIDTVSNIFGGGEVLES